MIGSRIPTGKRVINDVAPLDPTDFGEANANNLMFLWDNMGSGEYLNDGAILGRHIDNLFVHEQVSPNLTLAVDAGIFFSALNSWIIFAGANTPSIAAPITHNRIDVVTVRNDGTVHVIGGTEAVSPVPPTIPSTDIPLCTVLCVVGMTVIHDNDTQAGGQGYIQYDLRPFLQIAVGGSAMPKIGLVSKVSVTGSPAIYTDVVNFTGAGRLKGININGAAISGTAGLKIILDGTTLGTLTAPGNGDSKVSFVTGNSSGMFQLVGGASTFLEFGDGVFFKSSLQIQYNPGGNSMTTVVCYEHE